MKTIFALVGTVFLAGSILLAVNGEVNIQATTPFKGLSEPVGMSSAETLSDCIERQKNQPDNVDQYFHRKLDDIPPFPEPPSNHVYQYPANEDKKTRDVNEFICSQNTMHTRQDAIPLVREKVLHKNIRKVYPDETSNSLQFHPDRQVYVIVSKLYGEFEMKKGKVLNPVIYSLYDAETGFSYGGGYSGEPKNSRG
jgi:hypothetical protein